MVSVGFARRKQDRAGDCFLFFGSGGKVFLVSYKYGELAPGLFISPEVPPSIPETAV